MKTSIGFLATITIFSGLFILVTGLLVLTINEYRKISNSKSFVTQVMTDKCRAVASKTSNNEYKIVDNNCYMKFNEFWVEFTDRELEKSLNLY